VEGSIILEARNITKTFPGVVAVNNVTFRVYRGEVNALVGENGAGKSTLMKVLSGVYPDYEGKVILEGKEVHFRTPKEAQDNGIALIPQELDLVPNLSVAENVFLSREPVDAFGFVNYKKMYEKTSEILERLGVPIDPREKIEELSTGQQQMVAIAKALSLDSKVIIMDEPTSAISQHEIENLFKIIRILKQEGKSIVYISHKLDEIFEIADRLTIMRDGKIVGEGLVKDFSYDDVVKLMVGRSIDKFFVKEKTEISDEIFRVEDLCLWSADRRRLIVDRVSFYVRHGEVLGIYGLMGAGRSETLEAIFGVYPKRTTGKLFLEKKQIEITSPQDALRFGIGFVPEDRKLAGLILQLAVVHNISITSLDKLVKLGMISKKFEENLAEEYVKRLNIRATSLYQIVENLSGGNQQKVVLAKWLAIRPKVLLLDEPTRGIDVNAKSEIYKLISELAKSGMGVIMVSSELPEILAMSDRIVVMSEGKKTGEFDRSEATEEKLLRAAIPRSMRRIAPSV